MKSLIRILLSAILMLALAISVYGCGEKVEKSVSLNGDLRVVYASDGDSMGAAQFYVLTAKTQHGVDLSAKKDEKVPDDGTACELLVGNTNRAISAEAYEMLGESKRNGTMCYVILSSGGKCAVVGDSFQAMRYALGRLAGDYGSEIPDGVSRVEYVTEGEFACHGLEAAARTSSELDAIAVLNSIRLDGKTIAGFDPLHYDYGISLSLSDPIPTVTATAPEGVTLEITQAMPGMMRAAVKVTSPDGSVTKKYIIEVEKNEYDIMENVSIEKVYGGREGIVVIIHDDGTRATGSYLKEQFLKHNIRATLGLIGKNFIRNPDGSAIGTTQVDFDNVKILTDEVAFWQDLLDTGLFDVASHTMTHSFWGLTDEEESGNIKTASGLVPYSYAAGQITYEVAGSKRLFETLFPGQTVKTLIKAGFGRHENGVQISDKAFEIIKANYIAMRNSNGEGGVYYETIPIRDPYWMFTYQAGKNDTAETYINLVEKSIDEGGMQLFLFHKIEETPSSALTAPREATNGFFEWLGGEAASGRIWNAFYEDAVMYAEEYRYAKVEAKNYGSRIKINVTDELDNEIYSHALTVKVPIADEFKSVKCAYADGSIGDLEIKTDEAGAFVHIDVVPDSGEIMLICK